jgi:hypothetical protein
VARSAAVYGGAGDEDVAPEPEPRERPAGVNGSANGVAAGPAAAAASVNGWNVPGWDSGLAAPDPIRRPWNPPSWDAERSWSPPNLPALPEAPAPAREQPREQPREQFGPRELPAAPAAPPWEPAAWSPPAWDEPPAVQERPTPLRSPDWSMLDRLGPDRGLNDGTGTWSFVAPPAESDYELPSIEHLPDPEPPGRHARRAGRHSSGEQQPPEDTAPERPRYIDLTDQAQGRREPSGWESERWQGWGNGR